MDIETTTDQEKKLVCLFFYALKIDQMAYRLWINTLKIDRMPHRLGLVRFE